MTANTTGRSAWGNVTEETQTGDRRGDTTESRQFLIPSPRFLSFRKQSQKPRQTSKETCVVSKKGPPSFLSANLSIQESSMTPGSDTTEERDSQNANKNSSRCRSESSRSPGRPPEPRLPIHKMIPTLRLVNEPCVKGVSATFSSNGWSNL